MFCVYNRVEVPGCWTHMDADAHLFASIDCHVEGAHNTCMPVPMDVHTLLWAVALSHTHPCSSSLELGMDTPEAFLQHTAGLTSHTPEQGLSSSQGGPNN